METPKIVVFDLGKVLVDFDYTIAAEKIRARSSHPPGARSLFADFEGLLMDFEMRAGHPDDTPFFATICGSGWFSGNARRVRRLFCGPFHEDDADD